MNSNHILDYLAIGIGTLILYVALNQARTTRKMQRHLLKIAANLWEEAGEANQQSDRILIKLHNQIIEIAALAPAISAGIVRPVQNLSISKEEIADLADFVSRNSWVIPNISTAFLCLIRLQFHAEPWKFNNFRNALVARIIFQFFLTEKGVTRMVMDPQRTVDRVEQIAEYDSNRPYGNNPIVC